MSVQTLGPPPTDTPIVVSGNQVVLKSNLRVSSWLNLLQSILQRVAPMVQNDSFFINLNQLSVYANNAAALADGKIPGSLYRDGGDPDHVCVVK